MPQPLPGLLVGIMYLTAALVLLSPFLGRNRSHAESIRRRATLVWLLVTAVVVADYFNGSPQYAALVETILANVAAMVILLVLRRIFGSK